MSTSGMYLTATIGDTEVELEDNNMWRVKESAKELERTTGYDAGFGNVDVGVTRATITLHGWLDLATVAGGAFNAIRAGYLAYNLNLYYRSDDTTPAFTFPVVAMIESELGGEVDGQFEWTATAKNKGEYEQFSPDNTP